MSYCRWSSNDWQCDIYAYEDVMGGYTIHVASNRIVGDIPKADHIKDIRLWIEAHKKQMDWLDKNDKREKIGLPYDGESFSEPTLEDFKNRLLELRNIGYKFPDYVLETIDEEMLVLNPCQRPGNG